MSIDKALLSEVYEGEDKVVKMVSILDKVKAEAKDASVEAVERVLADKGILAPKLTKGAKILGEVRSIVKNHGVHPKTGKKYTFKDMQLLDQAIAEKLKAGEFKAEEFGDLVMSQTHPTLYFRQAISEVVKEAHEPLLVLTPLMQVVNTDGQRGVIHFPYMSSFTAGDLTIVEKGEYKEGTMQFTGETACAIGKHGIMVSMTDEAIRWCAWDIWGMYLRHAGKALAKHKEEQVVKHVFAQGEVFFNNNTISGRKTTGRDISGAYNGTFTSDDLFTMYADLLNEGYIPDLMLVHPFAWQIFVRDPILRNFAYLNNMPSAIVAQGYQGKPAATEMWSNPGLAQRRQVSEAANTATTYGPQPSYLPFGALRVVVTPFVDYDHTNDTTDIYLCDSRDIGILAVDEGITTEDWNDPLHDVKSTKFRERYGVASANNGRSIRIARGVVVAKAFDFSLSTIQASATLSTSEHVN